jgi:hypothetical protein
MGELVPFMLERSSYFMDFIVVNNTKTLEETWRKNVWVTTSGFFWLEQVPTLLRTTDVGHVMVCDGYVVSGN